MQVMRVIVEVFNSIKINIYSYRPRMNTEYLYTKQTDRSEERFLRRVIQRKRGEHRQLFKTNGKVHVFDVKIKVVNRF